MRSVVRRLAVIVVLVATLRASAAPDLIAYQGVLRDAQGVPLLGTYDMVFRFFSAGTGGDEILVDQHLTAAGLDVLVTNGLFTVDLGAGVVSDGGGPGTYTSLTQAFRAYGNVWLQLQIAGETLMPRVRLLSAPYALNAESLGGIPAGSFLDTSSSLQIKSGRLIVGAATGTGFANGVEGFGNNAGGYFKSLAGTGVATLGQGNQGIEARGSTWAGSFFNSSASGQAFLAAGHDGVRGFGNNVGGYFLDLDSSGEASVAWGDYGLAAHGTAAGAWLYDSGASGAAYVGVGDYGINGWGNTAGGFFYDANASGSAYAGYGDLGVQGAGNTAGGYFDDTNSSGYAYAGYGDYGLWALGSAAGGYFSDTNASGESYVGYGDYGIQGFGGIAGGFFKCNAAGYTGEVWLGDRNRGVWSRGTEGGGFFYDSDDTGLAWIGYGDTGVHASGGFAGLYAEGAEWGAEFQDTNGSGWARIAYGEQGMQAFGTSYGGSFTDSDSGSTAQVGSGSYKIIGAGTVSFVQNHPEDPSKVVVYHAPESSEVAVYTRGTGRLSNGTVSIPLDSTFAWVTNPDRGLTVHLTPRGRSCALYTKSISPERLSVGSDDAACDDADFDYMVWGLRIGFEELPPVTPKTMEAKIPSMSEYRELLSADPSLRAFTAGARFPASGDSALAASLLAKIGEFDPAVDPPPGGERPRRPRATPSTDALEHASRTIEASGSARSDRTPEASRAEARVLDAERPDPHAMRFPVAGDVEAGDVLTLAPDEAGVVKRADTLADSGIVGVAASAPATGPESSVALVEVIGSGFATVKVDAGYGAIRPGNLLSASPTPGHAMRAADPRAGTVLGKAIDGLEAGTGLIRVLLVAR
jgi:hypothetical protein